MKVGDYIRTTNCGIARVHKIIDGKCKFIKNRNNRITPYFGQIGEPSPNIIDLIEVGDIVEVEDMGDNRIIHVNDDRYLEDFKGYVANEYFEVKSLLTREQFESMKFVVGGK